MRRHIMSDRLEKLFTLKNIENLEGAPVTIEAGGLIKDNKTGRIMDGPEYITVFNGLTGAAMATADYIPERGRMEDWGDDHANRSERYLAAVGYRIFASNATEHNKLGGACFVIAKNE